MERGIVKTLPKADYERYLKVGVARLPIDMTFIHLLFADQLATKIPELFANEKEVFLLYLSPDKIEEAGLKVAIEANKPGSTLYPHLRMKAVGSRLYITEGMVKYVRRCKIDGQAIAISKKDESH